MLIGGQQRIQGISETGLKKKTPSVLLVKVVNVRDVAGAILTPSSTLLRTPSKGSELTEGLGL